MGVPEIQERTFQPTLVACGPFPWGLTLTFASCWVHSSTFYAKLFAAIWNIEKAIMPLCNVRSNICYKSQLKSTIQLPVLHINEIRSLFSLYLEMALCLAVLGHQQAQRWTHEVPLDYFTMSLSTECTFWQRWMRSGARPTNGSSIEFEIRSKFGVL